MADLGISITVDDVIDAPNFEPFPAGDYELQVVEADVKPNKKGTGKLLEYKAEIVSGEFAGRTVYERINYEHDNPTAQAIGQKAVQDMIKAAGLHGLTNTDQLLYQPFWAGIIVEAYTANNGEERARNVVKKYHVNPDQAPPVAKAPATPPNRPAPAARAAAPAAAGGLPWKRGAGAAASA